MKFDLSEGSPRWRDRLQPSSTGSVAQASPAIQDGDAAAMERRQLSLSVAASRLIG
jgi:hypothetical protein